MAELRFSEELVNTYTAGSQDTPQIAVLTGGGYVIVWQSTGQDGSSDGVYAQRFTASGVPVGPEFQVNTATDAQQQLPHVAALSNGGFVITWQDSSGTDGSGWGVIAQRFDASGAPQGANTVVNTTTSNTQSDPVVAGYAGGYAIAYTATGVASGNGYDIYIKRYDNAGNMLADETRVSNIGNTTNPQTSTQEAPSIAARTDGSLLVVWTDQGGADGSGQGVFARTVAANGTQGATLQINTFTSGAQYEPVVAALAGGGYVVVWRSDSQDGSSAGVYAQRLDNAGAKVGAEFRINESTAGGQYQPTVTALSTGGFVVSWYNDNYDVSGSGTTSDTYIREYTAAGVALAGQRKLASDSNSTEYQPAIADLGNGNYVVAYADYAASGSGGDQYDIRQQIFGSEATLPRQANPTLGDFTGTVTFAENLVNAAPQVIDAAVSLADADSANFAGGRLDLFYVQDGEPTDQLGVRNEGAGFGQVGVSGNSVRYAGTEIGTITGGSNGSNLVIQFNANATVQAIEALIENLTYASTSQSPAASRMLGIRVSDGDGGATVSSTLTIQVTPELDGAPVAYGEERVNTYTPNQQDNPHIAVLTGGGYVIVWQSTGQDGSNDGVYAQRFTASSVPVGPEFRVNTGTDAQQQLPHVAALSNGGFVVTWQDSDGTDGSGWGVIAQRYDASGTAQGANTVVNTTTSNTQSDPVVAGYTGGYAVAYTAAGVASGNGFDIYLKRYDNAGNVLADETRVSNIGSTTNPQTSTQEAPSIAARADGSLLVVWTDQGGADGASYGVFARTVAANGTQGATLQINTFTDGAQYEPAVAALAGGGYVVVWRSDGQDGSSAGVYAQRLDNAGNKLGGEFRINESTVGGQYQPTVTALSTGGFVVSWYNDNYDGADTSTSSDTYIREYTAAGVAIDGQRKLASTSNSTEWQPAIADLGSGNFVVVYADYAASGSDGAVYDIRQQIFGSTAEVPRQANPTLGDFTGTVTFAENLVNATPQVIDAAVSLTDADSANFAGGRVDLFYVQGGEAADQLGVRHQGTGANQIGVSGSAVSYAGTVIGTIAGGANGSNLAITLNANATVQAVEALVENLTYASTSQNPLGSRAVGVRVSDGDGGATTATTVTIQVTPELDGTPVVYGEERVSTYTPSSQDNPQIAVLTGGGYVIVWQSSGQDGSSDGVYAQYFLAGGTPVGAEFRVSTVRDGQQQLPQVAALSNGGVVVTWQDSNGTDGSGWSVIAQRFDANGTAQGPNTVVNTTTANTQYDPAVAGYGTGYAIAYTSTGVSGGNGYDIYLKRYDNAGNMLADETRVSNIGSTTNPQTGTQEAPSIAARADGSLLVVWTDQGGADGASYGVFARTVAANGTQGATLQINTFTDGAQYEPAVAALAGGGYVVVWRSDSQDGSGAGVYAQRLDNAGAKVGGEFRINESTTGGQYQPTVTALSTGGFVVGWYNDNYDVSGSGTTSDTYIREYTAAGVAIDGQRKLASASNSTEYNPAIADLGNGNFVVAYADYAASGSDGSAYDIRQQIFGSAATLVRASANPLIEDLREVRTLATNNANALWVGNPQRIDADVRIVDTDSADFAGGRLSVRLLDGVTATETLAIRNEGTGAGQIGVAGGNVSYGGTVIGTVTGDAAGVGVLVITLNASASAAAVQALVQNVTYQNTGASPVNRTVGFRLSDGDGGQSLPVDVQINLTANPSPAVVDVDDVRAVVQITESQANAGVRVDDAVQVEYNGAGTFAGGVLSVTYTSSTARPADQLAIASTGAGAGQVGVAGSTVSYQGTAIGTINATLNGSNGTNLSITFNASATAQAIERVIEHLQYSNTSSGPLASREIRIELSDSNNAQSVDRNVTIQIEAQSTPGAAVPLFEQQQTNTFEPGQQESAAVARLQGVNNGGYVITWVSEGGQDGAGYGVFAQRYAANGAAIGSEFQVNTNSLSNQYQPAITGLANGGFVVVWLDVSGLDGSGYSVRAQRYNADGSAAGAEFQASTTTTGNQYEPTVTGLNDGTFVIGYRSDYTGSDYSVDVLAQRFSAAGVPLGTEITLNTLVTGTQYEPQLAALSTGGFVATWTADSNADGNGYGVRAQRFAADGSKVGAEIAVNTTTIGNQLGADITALGAGRFVVAWHHDDNTVRAQIFNADGSKSGGELVANDTTDTPSNYNSYVRVTALESGGFVVGWDGAPSAAVGGSGYEVMFQQFTAAGAKVDGVVLASAGGSSTQYQPEIVGLTGSNFVVTWAGYGTETEVDNSYGVYHRIYGTAGSLVQSAAPVLADLAQTVTFAENTVNAAPQLIDPGVSLSDTDSANFAGGQLWVSVISGYGDINYAQLPVAARTQDQIGVRNQGTGAAQVSVSGSTVSYGGVAIGTIGANGANGSDLTITFNASATAQAVEALIENLTYANTSSNPVASRVLSLRVSDGDGGSSVAQTVTVQVTPDADGAQALFGNEQVNTYTPNAQGSPAMGRLADGGYVIVWNSTGQDGWNDGVYGQRFNNLGVAVGSEFQVNSYTPDQQQQPQVVGLNGGGYVVVWQSISQDGAGWGVYAQRFDANGVPAGAEVRVNATTSSNQYQPAVTATADGGYVVAWYHDGPSSGGEYYDIFFQRFNAAGVAQGSEIRGNPATQDSTGQSDPSVAGLVGGGFVLTWTDNGGDDSSYGVMAQRFAANGTAAGPALLVNSYTDSTQYEPSVTALEGGGFLVVWRSEGQDGSGSGVFGQRFAANGSKLGVEFRVNTEISGSQYDPAAIALTGGGFAVTWSEGSDIYVQQFDASGNQLDGPTRVDTTAGNSSAGSAIVALASGGFAVSWTAYDGSTGNYNIHQQVFGQAQNFPRQANPELVDVAASVTFLENVVNLTPQLIDSGVGLADADSANFDGGLLEVNYLTDYGAQDQLGLQGLGSQDQLGIRNQGSGPGQVGISGNQVSYAGTVIGTVVSNGANGAKLTVQFNANATPDAVEHVVENLTYANTASNPIASRTISIRVSDGDGGASAASQVEINVTPQVDGAVKSGLEKVANTTVAGNQATPDVTELADGGYVVVWADQNGADGNSHGVYGQRYDADNNAVGAQFRANTTTAGAQYEPQVAALEGGGFVVVWRSDGQDGSGAGVYAQRYGANGAVAGSEFRVNTTTTSNQYQPVITGTADGGFVVAWYHDGANTDTSSYYDVYFQRYNASGAPMGSETRGSTGTVAAFTTQNEPGLTGLAGGGFVLTWEDHNGLDGDGLGVFGQVYTAGGVPSGASFQVNSYTESSQNEAQITALQGGGFVVVWTSYQQDLSGYGVYGQRFDATGAKVGAEFRANTTVSSNQYQPDVTGLANGGWAVTWYDSDSDVYVQQYDAAGRQIDGETRVNSYTYSTQSNPSITGMSDGGFVIAYEGYISSSDTDGNGLPDGGNNTSEIRLQRFTNTAPVITDVSVAGQEEQVITLTAALFDSGFEDPDGQALAAIRIVTLPASGTLRLNGVELTSQTEVSIASLQAGALTYQGDVDYFGLDQFGWTGSDGVAFASTPVFTNITLANVNDGPRLQTISNGTASEGNWFTRTITLNDPDPEGASVTVNWGDGSAATVYQVGNTPDHSISHIYADNGNYAVTVTANDQQGQANSVETQNFQIAVANVAPTIGLSGNNTVAQGQSFTLSLGGVNDPGTDTVTQYRINWGDGSAVQVVAAASLPANRQLTHTYANAGTMAISVALVDEDGTFADAGTFSVSVSAPAETITVNAGQDVAVNEGASFSRTITFTDPTDQGAAGRTYTVDWGDGQTSTGNLGANQFSFGIAHTYADGSANYDVTVRVNDGDTQVGTDSFALQVNNVPPSISIGGAGSVQEGGTYTATLNRIDPGADTVQQYVIHWGDGSSQTVLAANIPANGQFTHVYADDNDGANNASARTITVDVVDEDGSWTSAGSHTLSVLNVAPTATVGGSATVAEGAVFTLSVGLVVDPGVDTRTGYSIDWGDGSTVQNFTPAEWASAAGSFTHVYADGATGGTARSVTVRATDEDGNFVLGTHSLTVANAAPTVTLGGAATTNEGATYTLAVAATDPAGANDTLGYSIDWGDGSAVQTLTAAQLAAIAGNVTHVFADDENGPVNATARTITVTANDGDGGITSQTRAVTVNNVAPTIALSGAASVQAGQAYTLNLGAITDPGTDTVSQYIIDWGDGSQPQTVTSAGNVAHTYASAASRTISVTLVDEDGSFANPQTVQVSVTAPTATLSLEAGADASVAEGSLFTRTVNFSDGQDNGAAGWSYSIDYGDGSAAVTGTTATTALNLSHLYADGSAARTVTVTVTDVAGETVSDSFVVTVDNVAPTATVGGSATVAESAVFTLSVGTVSDPGADIRTGYSIDWGDGAVQSFTPAQWTSAAGSFTHTYADGASGGTARTVTVRATDEDGSFVLGTHSLTVANAAPTVTLGGATTTNEGATYTLAVAATDPAGANDTLAYTIDWGDGSAVQTLTAAQLAAVAGNVTHVFADDQNGPVNATARTITVTANDGEGGVTSQTRAVTVNNVAPTIALSGAASVQAGQAYTLNLGAITDPGTVTVSQYIIDWGDGSQPQTVTSAGNVAHTYASAASRTISVTLVDEDGSFANPQTVQLSVTAPTATLSFDAGANANVAEGSVFTRTINFSDGQDNGAAGWSYSIDYGDGSAAVTGTTAATSLNLSHLYADGSASRTVSVTVTDVAGETVTDSFVVTVDNVAPSATVGGNATVAEGAVFTLSVGTVSDPGADTRSGYSIDWGDGVTQNFTPAQWAAAAGSFTHTYADGANGGTARTVTVRASDEDGTFTLGTHSLTVANAAPTVTLGGAATTNEGATYTLAVAAVDPAGANDTLAYTIDWGDGSAVQTLTAAQLAAVAGNVTHVFADDENGLVNATARTITVTANDGEGGVTSQTRAVTVNNVAPTIALSGAASVQAGQAYTLNLGAITDPGTDTVSQYIIDWGDGSQPQTVTSAGNVAHTYASAASRTISVTLVDEDGSFANPQTVQVNVTAASSTVSIEAGADATVDEGATFTRSIAIVDGADNGAAGWSYSINYGDGSAAVTGTTTSALLNLSHVFADGSATRTVTVTVTDVAGESVTDSFAVVVNNVAPTATLSGAATVNEGTLYTLLVGALLEPGADTRTAYSIDWGDGTSSNFTAQQWGAAAGSFTHTYADGHAGGTARTVTARATDEDGSFVLGTHSLTVNNVAPTVAFTGPGTAQANQAYTLNLGAVTDPGVDTPTGFLIDWGDGSQPAQVGTAGNVQHVYATAGQYTVRVSVADEDGSFLSPNTLLVDVAGSTDTRTVRVGDSAERQRITGQWAADWSADGVAISHTANASAAQVAWSAVRFDASLPNTLAGGDIYNGDLGVSGFSAATNTVRQEIDGLEALRFAVEGSATSVTLSLSRLFTNDDGTGLHEAGRARLYDATGALVGEHLFQATNAQGTLELDITSELAFSSVELSAGTTVNGAFQHGAYANPSTGNGSAGFANGTGLHGSDFLVNWAEFEVVVVGQPPQPA